MQVFRTNQSYARWHEGRVLWGALVNRCRNMVGAAGGPRGCWRRRCSMHAGRGQLLSSHDRGADFPGHQDVADDTPSPCRAWACALQVRQTLMLVHPEHAELTSPICRWTAALPKVLKSHLRPGGDLELAQDLKVPPPPVAWSWPRT